MAPPKSAAEIVPAWIPQEVSRLLLGILERRHLDALDLASQELIPFPEDDLRPMLRQVLRVGKDSGEPASAPATAMPYVLAASHGRGHAIVAVVLGSAARSRVFIGARRIGGLARGSTGDFLDGQASLLRTSAPGLELTRDPEPLSGALHDFIAAEASSFSLVTGVPSVRGEAGRGLGQGYGQTLDRLINTVSGRRYAMVVVAEPVGPEDLDQALDRCRDLRAQVHALARASVSMSTQEQWSQSITETRPAPEPALLTAMRYASSLLSAIPVAGEAKLSVSLLSAAGKAGGNLPDRPSIATTSGTSGSKSVTVGTDTLDAGAVACEELLDLHMQRMQRARGVGWWRTSVYVCADGDAALEAVTSALRGICSGDAALADPLRVLPLPAAIARQAMLRAQALRTQTAGHPLGPAYDALATCVNSDELALLVNLPRRDVPGIPGRDVADFTLSVPEPDAVDKSVPLGHVRDVHGQATQPLALTAATLNRHVLIAGMTGFGKTTTAKRLLVEARRAAGTPFLVIERAKAEYRLLAGEESLAGVLRVYGIGAGSPLPLLLNPFEPVGDAPLGRHIDLVKAVFNAAFALWPPLPSLLEEAMIEAYTERGWDIYSGRNHLLEGHPTAEDKAALLPTLRDVYDKLEGIVDQRGYAGEIRSNIKAALQARIWSLMLGGKGRALNTRRSTPAEELFGRPAVIELRDLGADDEKAFVMALLLCQLAEYAESRQGGSGLRHLTLIEEAHRLLRAAPATAVPDGSQSAALAVTMFTDLLAELRASGEGFIICDQIPTKLAPDTLKNTDVKILHRLVAADDRRSVAEATGMTTAQSRHLASLSPGEAIVHDQRLGAPVLATVDALSTPGSLNFALPDTTSRSYLRRNGGCRRCARPCESLAATQRTAERTDKTLAPLFEELLYSPGSVAASFARWRLTAGADAEPRLLCVHPGCGALAFRPVP